MNKISPLNFKKFYLVSVLSSLIMFLLLCTSGVIFITEDIDVRNKVYIGISLLISGAVFLFLFILVLLTGRKRYLNIEQEIVAYKLSKPLDEVNPILMPYRKGYSKETQGTFFSILEEGIKLGDDPVFSWDYFQFAEYYYDYIYIGNVKYGTEGHNGVFLPYHPLVDGLLKRFLKVNIDDTTYKLQMKDKEEIRDSTEVWRLNWLLLIEKMLYVIVVLLASFGVGFLFIKISGFNLYVSVIVAALVAVPSLIIYYPKLFKDSIDKIYLVNLEGIVYSKGRFSIFFDWFTIMKIEMHKSHIRLYYVIGNLLNYEAFHSIKLPMDKKFIDKMYEYKEEYEFPYDIEEINKEKENE